MYGKLRPGGGCLTPGKVSKKFPVNGLEVSAWKSGSARVTSSLSAASLGSRLKLKLLSPASDCIMRSSSGKGLGPLETWVASRRALISATSARACVDI